MIEELQKIIAGAEQEISDARNKMVTHHQHSTEHGWAVIGVEEYDSLIDDFEGTIKQLKERGVSKAWDDRDELLDKFEVLFEVYNVPDDILTKDARKLKKNLCELVNQLHKQIPIIESQNQTIKKTEEQKKTLSDKTVVFNGRSYVAVEDIREFIKNIHKILLRRATPTSSTAISCMAEEIEDIKGDRL